MRGLAIWIWVPVVFIAACAAEDGSGSASGDAGGDAADGGGDLGFDLGADTGPDGEDAAPSACQPACPYPAVCDESGLSPRCQCPAGYSDTGGDGRACEDIDECAAGADDCAGGAICVNAGGGFSCDCALGAIWDGATCIPTAERRLDAGDLHVCEIRPEGTLWCWGNNRWGQLGDGNQNTRSATPVQAGGSSEWRTVAAGGLAGNSRTCALRHDTSLWCWGQNLITGTAEVEPVQLVPEQGWIALDQGSSHACAVKDEGSLWCWGTNGFGQMGTPGVGTGSAVPVQVGNGNDWVAVATGDAHACGLQNDGTAWCWGINQTGEVGDGTTERRDEPVQVGDDTDWAIIEAGAVNTCGIRDSGALYCWGSNSVGQVGSGQRVAMEAEPARIGSDGEWRRIEVGGGFTCGIRSDGSLWCWGNLFGFATTTVLTPQRIGEDNDWVEVTIFSMGLTAGGAACGRHQDGSLTCWGLNDSGQLGLGSFGDKTAPGRVGQDTWAVVEARSYRTLAIAGDGTLWGWGTFLGANGMYETSQVPVRIDASTDWTALAAAESHQCGLRADGTLWCWGYDGDGALGLGETSMLAMPSPVGSATWETFDVGGDLRGARTCGVHTDGTLWCWGADIVGDGTQEARNVPTRIGEEDDWTAVSVGTGICGLRAPGTAWCWGELNESLAPVQVGEEAPEDDWIAVDAGINAHYGIRAPGTLWTWGEDGIVTPIAGAEDWTAVEEMSYITCGLRGEGSLWCWGWDLEGYVTGRGGTLQAPTRIGEVDSWTDVSVGGIHICGLQDDESLWCWGEGQFGRLGTGDAWIDEPTRLP